MAKDTNTPAGPARPEPESDLAEARLDKLRQIEALGLDPWGQRFDGHTALGDGPPTAGRRRSTTPTPGPTVRAAGRVVRHRTGGKLHFLEIWDQTGRVQVWCGSTR